VIGRHCLGRSDRGWRRLRLKARRSCTSTSSQEYEPHEELTTLSFSLHILPPTPLPSPSSSNPCPLPLDPSNHPHLVELLSQTTQHLTSSDSAYLVEKGVTAILTRLTRSLQEEMYAFQETGRMIENESSEGERKRLVDCLPCIGRWGRDVWEGVPDHGIEVSWWFSRDAG
jgi:peroxin-3